MRDWDPCASTRVSSLVTFAYSTKLARALVMRRELNAKTQSLSGPSGTESDSCTCVTNCVQRSSRMQPSESIQGLRGLWRTIRKRSISSCISKPADTLGLKATFARRVPSARFVQACTSSTCHQPRSARNCPPAALAGPCLAARVQLRPRRVRIAQPQARRERKPCHTAERSLWSRRTHT